ncbi:MBL fold metallo-hydrolase, partial [bacterium]|nr:MBL fold metallo-hydrolase [bacterium]
RYKFKNINYFLIECNYTEEIVKKNLEIGVIEKTRYKRLLRSHMSLENCIEFLRHNVSIDTKKIILIHLSDENSDEKKMVNDIYDVFHVETIAAINGEIIRLEKYPF